MSVQYNSLREKIAAENEQRNAQQVEWAYRLRQALALAGEAGEAAVPTPMVVTDETPGQPRQSWYVSEGVCGFAWVILYAEKGGPSRQFINWLTGKTKARSVQGTPPVTADKYVHSSYWISASGRFGQSLTRKEAWARVLADEIRKLEIPGLKVYADSRLD